MTVRLDGQLGVQRYALLGQLAVGLCAHGIQKMAGAFGVVGGQCVHEISGEWGRALSMIRRSRSEPMVFSQSAKAVPEQGL
jgi:hypothetical protein